MQASRGNPASFHKILLEIDILFLIGDRDRAVVSLVLQPFLQNGEMLLHHRIGGVILKIKIRLHLAILHANRDIRGAEIAHIEVQKCGQLLIFPIKLFLIPVDIELTVGVLPRHLQRHLDIIINLVHLIHELDISPDVRRRVQK